MIFKETKLKVIDNSGGLTVKCFQIFKKNTGNIGTLIISSVKTFKSGKKVKKGEIYKGVIIHTKSSFRRKNGIYLNFINNNVVLWKRKEESPIGTRIKGLIPIELRFLGFTKIISLSLGTI